MLFSCLHLVLPVRNSAKKRSHTKCGFFCSLYQILVGISCHSAHTLRGRSRSSTTANSRQVFVISIRSAFPIIRTFVLGRGQLQLFTLDFLRYVSSFHGSFNNTTRTNRNLSNIFTGDISCSGNTSISVRSRPSTFVRFCFNNSTFLTTSKVESFRHLRTSNVVLVSRQSDSSQDTDNSDNDHQLDKGEAFLHFFHGLLHLRFQV